MNNWLADEHEEEKKTWIKGIRHIIMRGADVYSASRSPVKREALFSVSPEGATRIKVNIIIHIYKITFRDEHGLKSLNQVAKYIPTITIIIPLDPTSILFPPTKIAWIFTRFLRIPLQSPAHPHARNPFLFTIRPNRSIHSATLLQSASPSPSNPNVSKHISLNLTSLALLKKKVLSIK